jgi:hypothetical protein
LTVRIAILSAEAGFSESLHFKTVSQRDMDESVKPQKLLKLSENNVVLTVSIEVEASSSWAEKTASSKAHAALEVPGAERFRADHCQT